MAGIGLSCVKEMIIASGAEMSSDVEIDMSTEFEAVGLDSLDMFGLLSEIDERYSVVISDDEADKFLCFGDVINFLTERAGSS